MLNPAKKPSEYAYVAHSRTKLKEVASKWQI